MTKDAAQRSRWTFYEAVKFEAFRDRGKGDLMASPDLEDIITMMVETPTFEKELREADINVKNIPRNNLRNWYPTRIIVIFSPHIFEVMRPVRHFCQNSGN